MSSDTDILSGVKNKLEQLTKIVLSAGMVWVLVMMFLTTSDVAGRYFFSKPIPGAIEMSEFLLAVFGILGMAYTHLSGANVKVTMLTRVMPKRLERLVETITTLFSFQIIAMLSWYGFVLGVEEFQAGTTTDTLSIPLYPLYFLLGFGAVLLSLVVLVELVEAVLGLFGRRAEVSPNPQ